MAIFHLRTKTVSRGSGSASAKSDYITREGKYQSDRAEVESIKHDNFPEWAKTPGEYWQAADQQERANGRLCVTVEIALPKELNKDQQRELAETYCAWISKTESGKKLPYSMAIHKGRDEPENPHFHLMISERVPDGIERKKEDWFKRANSKNPAQGGAKKTAELHSKNWIPELRQKWEVAANFALEKAGHETSIDRRTLAEQGIDRQPQMHLGPAAAAMERKNKNNSKIKNQFVTGRWHDYQVQRAEIAQAEAQTQAEAKIKANAQAEAQTQAEAKIKANAKAEAQAQAEAKPETLQGRLAVLRASRAEGEKSSLRLESEKRRAEKQATIEAEKIAREQVKKSKNHQKESRGR